MNRLTVEYRKAVNGEYFVRIRAGNGKILVTTETYKKKASAKNAIYILNRAFRGEGTMRDRVFW